MSSRLVDKRPSCWAAILLCVLLSACGGDDEIGLFTKADAEEVARLVIKAWGEGRTDEVLKRCTSPFHFRTRLWVTPEKLKDNLGFQVDRLRTEAVRFTRYEVFSRNDLAAGLWPRGRQVPEEKREEEIGKLGVSVDGFLVRTGHERQRGWRLVINPDDSGQLKVQGVYP